MLRRVLFLCLYFLAWVVLFQLTRLLFLAYHYSKAKEVSFLTKLGSAWYGLRMDFSMASYLLALVGLFVLLSVFVPFFRRAIIYKAYSGLLLFFFLLITIADLEVYKQWGFRIDATPLKYLSSPNEAWASVSHLPLVWYLLSFALVYLLVFLGFSKFLKRTQPLLASTTNKWFSALALVCFLPLLIIPLRGGFGLTPINQSTVYFSDQPFANHAAINASWNFLHGLMNKTSANTNPYNYLDYTQAKKITDSLYAHSSTTQQLLKTTSPNIVLIIWESFTAKVLSAAVEGKEVVPHFKKLRKEGVFFLNLYASGDRTDKGLAAILSGYPALPTTSIIRSPNKAAKLPVLPKLFKEKGYTTPFYYGGEAAFANIKSYLGHAGCSPIIEKNVFPERDQNSKWGVHDGIVASRLGKDISKMKKPFFATWLTLTSHEPFEIPTTAPFKSTNDVSRFLASINYTDKVLGDFIQGAKQQPWWVNTLIIIISDHGHVYPESSKLQNFTIPMLWLGGALKQTNLTIDKVGSQLDLAATLIAQTNFTKNPFPFSKNMLDSVVRPWAFFSFNNGCGLVQKDKTVLWDHVGKKVMMQEGPITPTDINNAKAIQQVFYQDFLEK